EYLLTAVEEGLLHRDRSGKWHLVELDSLPGRVPATPSLPNSLRGLIERRLAGLSTAAQQITSCAAILGRENSLRIVKELSNLDETLFLDALSELDRRQILTVADIEFLRFWHNQTYEVAYNNIDPEERVRLHLAAAEIDQRAAAITGWTSYAEIGHHWEQGGRRNQARQCYLRAARTARNLFANIEADRLYQNYNKLVDDVDQTTVTIRIEYIKHILILMGRLSEALSEIKLVIKTAREFTEGDVYADALLCQAEILWRMGKMEEALPPAMEALKIDRAIGNREAEAGDLEILALIHHDQAQYDKAKQNYELALVIQREIGDRRSEGTTLNNLALLFSEQDHTDQALAMYYQALKIHEEVNNLQFKGITLGNIAIIEQDRGYLVKARELTRKALKIHKKMGNRRFEALMLGNLASMEQEQGNPEQAMNLAQQALSIHQKDSNKQLEGHTLGTIAAIHYFQGHPKEAFSFFQRALQCHEEVSDLQEKSQTLRSLGQLHGDNDEIEVARDFFQQALVIHRQLIQKKEEALTLVCQARTERRIADGFTGIAELLQRAEILLKSAREPYKMIQYLCEKGHFLLANNRSAISVLHEALNLAESVHLTPETKSVCGQALARLQLAQNAFEAGQQLFRGECLADLPQAIQNKHRQG
ncbi:tetratricopeptide repeat protein, partial [candidate division CSSED10-310 bacterium]